MIFLWLSDSVHKVFLCGIFCGQKGGEQWYIYTLYSLYA